MANPPPPDFEAARRALRDYGSGATEVDAAAPPDTPMPAVVSNVSSVRRHVVVAIATVLVAVVGGASWWGWHHFVDTSDRAVHRLQAALRDGRVDDARSLVSDTVWPTGDTAPAPEFTELLNDPVLTARPIAWTETAPDGGGMVRRWTTPSAVPELTLDKVLAVERVDGDWKIVYAPTELHRPVAEVAQVLAEMRAAAAARDGGTFLSFALPGDDTCTVKTCSRVQKVIASGETHPFVEAVRMDGLVPGSMKIQATDDQVTLRWLRRTRFLGQSGLVSLRFDRVATRWKVALVDAGHFAALDDELETWTENHNEMLWRREMAAFVEVRELPGYCDHVDAWGDCALWIRKLEVKNVGSQTISVMVSANRVGRYFADAELSMEAFYLDVRPGEARTTATLASDAVTTSLDAVKLPFTFLRIKWITFDGKDRRDYAPKDYREVTDGSVTFDIVRDTRVAVGVATSRVDELLGQVTAAGYDPGQLPSSVTTAVDAKAQDPMTGADAPARPLTMEEMLARAKAAEAESLRRARAKVEPTYWDPTPDLTCTGEGPPSYAWTYSGGTYDEDALVAQADGCRLKYDNCERNPVALNCTTFCCPFGPKNAPRW